MIGVWKKIELEWKILILAAVLFTAYAWPVQRLFVERLTTTLNQSIDPHLDALLRESLSTAREDVRDDIVASIERARQWKALIPLLIREQRQVIMGFTLVLMVFLFTLALWTVRSMTRPLKNLAVAVHQIGKGNHAEVVARSGGALGTVENAVIALQDELRVLREQARMQGMEKAWKDIARVMAHEIKNPLTPIRLSLDRVEEKVLSGETVSGEILTKFLGRMNTQVDILERLVNQFRSFSRDPDVQLCALSIGESIGAIGADMVSRIQTEITGDCRVMADPYVLNQVFLNLWKNAVEAGARTIRVSVETEDLHGVITCVDDGPGVPDGDCEKIWLPYVSFTEGGTGLGLPVVKRCIETMNGSISARSVSGKSEHGLTITIRLPLENTREFIDE